MVDFLAIDTETTGLNRWKGDRPFMFTSFDDRGNSTVLQWDVCRKSFKVKPTQKHIDKIRKQCDQAKKILIHNAAFDVGMLFEIGVDLTDRMEAGDIIDTHLMSHVFHSGELHGLKPLAVKYCRVLDDDEKALRAAVIEARKKHPDMKRDIEACYFLAPKECELYGANDVLRLQLLFQFYRKRFDEDETGQMWHHFYRQQALQPIWYSMTETGLILLPHAEDELARYAGIVDSKLVEMKKLAKSVARLDDYNPNSGPQTGKILYDYLGFEPRMTESGKGYSTKHEILVELKGEACTKNQQAFIDLLLSYREYETASAYLTNYIGCADDNREIHASFNQVGTRFTRGSSSNPNGQNIGKPDEKDPDAPNLRGVFGPHKGYRLVSIDYSQLEGRLMAALSGDPLLNKIIIEGRDWHEETAIAIFGEAMKTAMRKLAKNMNFTKQYGGGPKATLRYCEGNYEKAVEFSNAYDQAYSGVTQYRRELTRECHANGGAITTAFLDGYGEGNNGYKVYPKHVKDAASGKIQGTAGEIIKQAMLDLWNDHMMSVNRSSSRMVLQIHDELMFEFKERPAKQMERDVSMVGKIMQLAGRPFNTPTSAKIFDSAWGGKGKEVKV